LPPSGVSITIMNLESQEYSGNLCLVESGNSYALVCYNLNMQNKFSYFDLLANVVPGTTLLGLLYFVWPNSHIVTPTTNVVIDLVLFTVFSFVVGALVQQCSKYTVEPALKFFFWRRRFFSEIYLVDAYGLCPNPLRDQVMRIAKEFFAFRESDLSCLGKTGEATPVLDPHVVSHQIYRKFDYYTLDRGLAQKAHLANTLYSLYRGLTFVFIIGFFASGISYLLGNSEAGIISLISLIALLLFLLRARREAEQYIKGLLSTPVNNKV